MERREHDIMMDMIANPGMSFDNLVTVGLTANNTALQDRSTYENSDWVREHFKDQYGEFDKLGFDVFYNNAKVYYNALASANYEESMKKLATFHRDNIFAPVEQRRTGPDYIEFQASNPYLLTLSIHELGRVGGRTKSMDELALANKVLLNPTTAGDNLENAQWGDTPNDNFWGYFTDTLVMALYDSDGYHLDPFTGEKVEHKAGELKLDNDGNFYYEKLDGRDIYGRRVLNKMNVLTTDGSFWNQYDFFDSDDLNQKSVGGTILKNLALVGSMFIPYVGPWIAGLSIATQTAGLLGTLGKMASGSDSPTFSALEGWSKSMSRQGAVSEYAQEHTWCWENFINLIGDVAAQLTEQRFIFEKVPYIFKGANMMSKEGQAAKLAELKKKLALFTERKIELLSKIEGVTAEDLYSATINLRATEALRALAELDSFIKGYNKIGEILSKGYMTAITVGDTYGEAKLAGASDLDATLLTLGYAAGEYAILNTGIGEWILPELRAGRYKALAIARALTAADDKTKNLYAQFGKQLTNFSKEGKKEYTKKLFNIGRDIAKAEYANGTRTLKATLAAGAGEGVEEVSEELLADFSKGCYDVVKWLQGEDTRINTFGYDFKSGKWDGSEVVDRYGMSLIGGAVGGSLTNVVTNYKMINSFNNMSPELAIQELVYMARNGGLRDFAKQANKMQLGDTNMSTDYTIEGNNIIFNPATKENSQDAYIKKVLNKQILLIESILSANGAVSDSKFLDSQTLGDLRFLALHNSSTAGRYLLEYNSLSSRLVRLVTSINEKVNSVADTNGDGVVTDREQRKAKLSQEELAAVKNLETELKEVKQLMDDLVSGKRAFEFIADSLWEMTSALSGVFATTSFPLFAEQEYGRKFSELTEEDKAKAYEKYKTWKTTEGKEKIHTLAQTYLAVTEQASETIKKHADDYVNQSRDLLALNAAISKLYTEAHSEGNHYYLPLVTDEALYLELAQNATDEAEPALSTKLVLLLGTEEDSNELRSILERVKDIDPNATNEEKKQQRTQIGLDYANKLDEILLKNISSYIQPILDRGFANAETKNLLTQLLKVVSSRASQKVGEWEEWALNELDWVEYETAVNPYEQLVALTTTMIRAVDLLSATPIELNLNEFAISVGSDPVNLTLLIQRLNDSFNDVSDNVTKFTIENLLQGDLENAIFLLQLYKASIRGARTDGASLNNIFGFNATLNEVSRKIEGTKEFNLAEIDKNIADVFEEDIQTNLNKLEFFKKLYDVNLGLKLSKLDRVATKKDLLIYKRLRAIVDIPDNDPLSLWEGFVALKAAIEGMTLHKLFLRENSTVVSEDLREEFEKEKIAAENAIYDFFNLESNKLKLNDPTLLALFINPDKLQLYTEAKELLNEGLESLDDNSIVWWIASRAALRSLDFYYQYHQIIDPEAEKPLAPIATLELAIYNNYASIVNGNMFTAFYNAYRYAITEDWKNKKSVQLRTEILEKLGKDTILATDELAKFAINFLSAPRYQNIILTEGIPGSGKSTGVFLSTLKLLQKFHPELLDNVAVVHGADDGVNNSAKNFRDGIGLTEANSKIYGREAWMKEINPTWREYSKNEQTDEYEVPTSDYMVTGENEIRSKLPVKDTTNPPKLIIIDEISKFSAYDLDLIDAYAKKYGITVLVAGDFDQSGVVGSHKLPTVQEFNGLVWKIELSRTNFIRSPKLGVSMRTDNSLKTLNLLKLLAYMQDPNGECTFNYYEDETGLYGDKVLLGENINTVLPQALAEIDKLIATLKEDENGNKGKIGYIYSSKTSALYLALLQDAYKNYIDFKEGGSALGLEGQYYIIEANADVSSKQYLKDVYTGISRAQQGSLLIAPLALTDRVTGTVVKFADNAVSEKIGEPLRDDVIISFAKKRKEVLQRVTEGGLVSQIIPRTSEITPTSGLEPTPPPTNDDATDDELGGPIDSTPPTDPDNTPPPPAPDGMPPGPETPPPPGPDDAPPPPSSSTSTTGTLPPDVTTTDTSILVDNISGHTLTGWLNSNLGYLLNSAGLWIPVKITNQYAYQLVDGTYSPGGDSRNALLFLRNNMVSIADGAGGRIEVSPDLITGIVRLENGNHIDITQEILDEANNFLQLATPETESTELNQTPPPEAAQNPPIEPLIYELDIAPITNTDVINEQDYQQHVDQWSASRTTPEATAVLVGEKISIEMLLHSFNSFELGVDIDPTTGKALPIGSQQWMDSRIDSINGLIKIDKVLNKPLSTVAEYGRKIGRLRSAIFNTADKATLLEKLKNILGISDIYCTFALKSSPRPSSQNRASGREFVSSNPNPFERGISEETIFNGSTDTRSSEWNPKEIVLIIGTLENGNLLELPLLMMSSPFTLLQTKDLNRNRVFSAMYNRFTLLQALGMNLRDISLTLVSEFDGKPLYQELVNLFKIFNFTDGAVFYIDDKNWTPAKDLLLEGPLVITDKGYYLMAPGLSMNDTTNPESEWLTIADFANRPIKNNIKLENSLCYVTKKVMQSLSGYADGVSEPVAKAGHSFVLVSFDRELNSDIKVVRYYIRQLQDPSLPKKVKLMYVLPPHATVKEYLANVHKILTRTPGVESIGNLFTSYKLLKELMKSQAFKTRLELKLPGATAAITDAFSLLEGKSLSEQKDILYTTFDWSTVGGLGNLKLAGLFDAVLVNVAYTRRTLGDDSSFSINEADATLIADILAQGGIDRVYYKPKITRDSATLGPFVIPDGQSNWSINGKPFRIHGKLDSYTFKGNMGGIVDMALSKMRQNPNGHGYSTDNSTYVTWQSTPNGRIGIPGKSDLTTPPIRNRRESEAQRLKRNVIAYVLRRTSSVDATIYDLLSLTDANKKVVELVNSDNTNKQMAFTIGNEIVISSESNYIDGPVYIQHNGLPVTDISLFADSTGKYNFDVHIWSTTEGKMIETTAVYDSTTKTLELTLPLELNLSAVLSITPENFTNYTTVGKNILEEVLLTDIFLADVFNAASYDEFMQALLNLVYIGEDRISALEEIVVARLMPASEGIEFLNIGLLIIRDLIAYEKSINPFNEDESEQNEGLCPKTIKINFNE